MSEKLCLKWNDFLENVNTAFGDLRQDKDFTDVTLACEDGQQIEAHKLILVASSPFFQNLLSKNKKKHHHPLVYMKGLKFEDLLAILDFLYLGEANVFQESLDSFLAIAEDLKLRGLVGQNEDSGQKTFTKSQHPSLQQMNSNPLHNKEKPTVHMNSEMLTEETFALQIFDNKKVDIQNFVPGDLQRLDEKVKSLMEKSANNYVDGTRKAYICKVCRKEGHAMAIRDHIEAHHLEGVRLPCNVCGRECRSRNNLRRHTCIPK